MAYINGGIILIVAMVIVAIILTTVYGYYLFNNSEVGGYPAIEITPPSHDFGTIPKEEVSHTFIVKNSGTDILEIEKISTSCACTTAKIELEELDPGQSTNMVVTFDPNAMESIEENVFRIVYIRSNDPNNPEKEVEIRAKVLGGSR
jgi:hypothetical protein